MAIKMLDTEQRINDPLLVGRFLREGEALRRLNHPNIVTMLAAGEKDGRHYLVMEYIDGDDLQTVLRRQRQMPLDRVLAIALDLADQHQGCGLACLLPQPNGQHELRHAAAHEGKQLSEPNNEEFTHRVVGYCRALVGQCLAPSAVRGTKH